MMTAVRRYCADLTEAISCGWNQFWFRPEDPATLGLIRIFTGAMLLYTHAVWSIELLGFFGERGRLPVEFARAMNNTPFAWSHLYFLDDSPTLLWMQHLAALIIFFCLMIGFMTRYVAWAAFLLTVAYANRSAGALFGLDQINGFLAMYLAVGPAGAAYSLDQRGQGRAACPSVSANIALRLIQCHMCVVYLFAGLGKLLGPSWWAGTALWGAFANLEYQTLDMTWVASHPIPVNFVTQLILVWEITYIALIWPRITRPLMLALAIPLHLGIGICMGMITFGLIMLVGNLAFVPPAVIRALHAPRSEPEIASSRRLAREPSSRS